MAPGARQREAADSLKMASSRTSTASFVLVMVAMLLLVVSQVIGGLDDGWEASDVVLACAAGLLFRTAGGPLVRRAVERRRSGSTDG